MQVIKHQADSKYHITRKHHHLCELEHKYLVMLLLFAQKGWKIAFREKTNKTNAGGYFPVTVLLHHV